MELKEYIKDIRTLNETGLTLIEQYAKELDVKTSVLWADICSNNPMDVVLQVESLEDLRTLRTKYKKRTTLDLYTEAMEIVSPGMGMAISRGYRNAIKSRKSKRVWNNQTKKYERG